jgi:hypothetical protein
MKKIILFVTLFVGINYTNAQNLNYGVLVGINAYGIETNSNLTNASGFDGKNIGGFVDYQLNTHFGIRGNLVYNWVKENSYRLRTDKAPIIISNESVIKSVQFHALLKYDVNKVYNKGFYLIGGFRMTNIIDAKIDNQEDNNFYKRTNFAAMLGFGVNFAKHFGLELIPEINLTNTINFDEYKTKNSGAYLNFTVNLATIINKK